MTENKTVKLIIPIEFLVRETKLSFDFNSRANMRGKWINLPKSQITDFKRVVTKFRKWNSSSMRKAFSFRIPMWIYIEHHENIRAFKEYDIIVQQFNNNK